VYFYFADHFDLTVSECNLLGYIVETQCGQDRMILKLLLMLLQFSCLLYYVSYVILRKRSPDLLQLSNFGSLIFLSFLVVGCVHQAQVVRIVFQVLLD